MERLTAEKEQLRLAVEAAEARLAAADHGEQIRVATAEAEPSAATHAIWIGETADLLCGSGL